MIDTEITIEYIPNPIINIEIKKDPIGNVTPICVALLN